MQNHPDEQLVKGYIKGDIQCFRILYERYQSRLFFLVKRFIRNNEQAEEVFQEIFIKAITKMSSFDGSGSFKSWLFALARNHCIDRIRSNSRKREISENALTQDDNEISLLEKKPDMAPLANELTYEKELSQKLNVALESLPTEQMEVFVLKERWGMNFEEIAQQTKISVNTVKSRMRYALQTLRRNLKDKAFIKEARA